MGKLDLDRSGELYRAICESPEFFFREILGAEPYDEQIPVIKGIASSRRVSVKSGHSCGKDWLAARAALWFHVSHYPSIVVTTGPTDRQVKNVVWGEIAAAYANAKIPIGGRLLTQEIQSGDPRHYMIGYTAKSAEAFQGFHSDNVMIIVTEASGIEPEIWRGIDSLMTARSNAKLLCVGNALYEPGSEFVSMFGEKSSIYSTYTLDSEKSPYCSKEWIKDMRDSFGEDSPVWQARVKGIFPTDSADTLFPLGWIERAHAKWGIPGEGVRSLGVDVARFGSDLTVFCDFHGTRAEIVYAVQGHDLMDTAGRIIRIAKERGISPEFVRIDDTGVGGGVTDRLHEQGFRVTPINFGSKASDEEKYANARSEMYWTLRDRLRAGDISLDPRDRKLLRDLSVIKYKMTSKGQIQLEAKAEMKSRLGNSPDRSDALVLAALPQAIASEIATGGKSNRGLFEYMREMATKQRADAGGPVTRKLVSELPEASALLEGEREQRRLINEGHRVW